MPDRIGYDCNAYVDVAGVGLGTWLKVDIAQDITPTDADSKVEVPDRRSRHKRYTHGRDDLALELVVTQDTTDPAYIALRDARRNKSVIGVAYTDGDLATEDTEGWQYDAKVFSMEPNIQIDDVLATKFMLAPASGADVAAPDYVITDVA